MIKIQQTPQDAARIPQTEFVNDRLARVGLEVIPLNRFRRPQGQRDKVHRVNFFLVILVSQGQSDHLVDFESIRLTPSQVIFVQPGSAQQWCVAPGLEGEVLLISPSVAQPAQSPWVPPAFHRLNSGEWPRAIDLSEPELANCLTLVRMLKAETERQPQEDWSVALARELFLCLMLTLARCAQQAHGPAPSAHWQLFRQLQQQLDRVVGLRPSVAGLAQALGVSTSSLSRACQQSVGRSAKQVVDQRVALEAKRLLVHSTATVSAIGEQLGFSEPTNFQKFFKRQAHTTPESFRRAHASASSTHLGETRPLSPGGA